MACVQGSWKSGWVGGVFACFADEEGGLLFDDIVGHGFCLFSCCEG